MTKARKSNGINTIEDAVDALLDEAMARGLDLPDVHYYRTSNGRHHLELGCYPPNQYCQNGEPKRISYGLTYDPNDRSTVPGHVLAIGRDVIEVLRSKQSTKH